MALPRTLRRRVVWLIANPAVRPMPDLQPISNVPQKGKVYLLIPDGIVHGMGSNLRLPSQYQPRDGIL